MNEEERDIEQESFKLQILTFFQAAREIANTLARAPNVVYLPGGKDQQLLLGI